MKEQDDDAVRGVLDSGDDCGTSDPAVGTLEEWREMAGEAIDVALHWKERAIRAERFARLWKAAAKRWRESIVCDIDTEEPPASVGSA